MANKTVVLAIFNDEASADTAADALKKSGIAHHDAIGVLALNDKGEVKAHKVGKRSVGLGIGIGLVLALFSPIGLVVGLVGGGLLGALHHKGLGIDPADRERIGRELQGGKAAVGVLAPVSEAKFVADKLTELGGAAETHEVSDEALGEPTLPPPPTRQPPRTRPAALSRLSYSAPALNRSDAGHMTAPLAGVAGFEPAASWPRTSGAAGRLSAVPVNAGRGQ